MSNAVARRATTVTLFGWIGLLSQQALSQTIQMQSAATLPGAVGASNQIIGGAAADVSKWPATFVFRNSAGEGCTATAVGARTILTAAHCVENASNGVLSFRGSSISLTCSHHPSYPAEIGADYALCLTQDQIPAVDFRFETLDSDGARPVGGNEIGVLGYGCVTVGGQDHDFGTLYEGSAKITLARDNSGFIQANGAALCFGDSGGGAYLWLNQDKTLRHLFAVNARGDISTNSYLAPTASSKFHTFAESWTAAYGVKICGVNPEATNCRQ